MGGLNQLWRNLLLALAIEEFGVNGVSYNKIFFSVVHHPDNNKLNKSMNEFKALIGNDDSFFSFTSDQIIDSANKINDVDITKWVRWYKERYPHLVSHA
jgi:hypothetical protein